MRRDGGGEPWPSRRYAKFANDIQTEIRDLKYNAGESLLFDNDMAVLL